MKPQRNFSTETLIIAGSFVAVWIYFIARIWAGRAQVTLSPFWQVLLLPALVLLVIIFVKRLRRVARALRGEFDDAPTRNGQHKK